MSCVRSNERMAAHNRMEYTIEPFDVQVSDHLMYMGCVRMIAYFHNLFDGLLRKKNKIKNMTARVFRKEPTLIG